MPVCHILVGLPCSGKSTYIRDNFYLDDGYHIHSTDNELHHIAKTYNMSYGEAWSKHFKAAEIRANANLAKAATEGKDIIWDQTNLTKRKRATIKAILPDYKFKYHIMKEGLDGNLETIFARNKARTGQTIPEHVIRDMLARYEPVTEDEIGKK